MIEIKELCFGYDEDYVLDHLSCTILESSGLIQLAGKNGCGKSTLLQLLCGYLLPDEGELHVSSSAIAYLPFENPLFEQLSVRENLRYFYRCFRGEDFSEEREEVREILDALRIDYLDHKLMKCSSGQKQKAAIACILLSSAQVLLLDEPFVAVDGASVEGLIDYLKKRKRQTLILLVSHTTHSLMEACDRLLYLKDGHIAADLRGRKELQEFMESELCE